MDVVQGWVWPSRQPTQLDIKVFHFRIILRQTPQVPLVPGCNSGFHQSIPFWLCPCWSLQEGEGWWKSIFLADKLDMVGPGGGGAATHLQYVQEHGVDSAGRVAPDIVEEVECANVK